MVYAMKEMAFRTCAIVSVFVSSLLTCNPFDQQRPSLVQQGEGAKEPGHASGQEGSDSEGKDCIETILVVPYESIGEYRIGSRIQEIAAVVTNGVPVRFTCPTAITPWHLEADNGYSFDFDEDWKLEKITYRSETSKKKCIRFHEKVLAVNGGEELWKQLSNSGRCSDFLSGGGGAGVTCDDNSVGFSTFRHIRNGEAGVSISVRRINDHSNGKPVGKIERLQEAYRERKPICEIDEKQRMETVDCPTHSSTLP